MQGKRFQTILVTLLRDETVGVVQELAMTLFLRLLLAPRPPDWVPHAPQNRFQTGLPLGSDVCYTTLSFLLELLGAMDLLPFSPTPPPAPRAPRSPSPDAARAAPPRHSRTASDLSAATDGSPVAPGNAAAFPAAGAREAEDREGVAAACGPRVEPEIQHAVLGLLAGEGPPHWKAAARRLLYESLNGLEDTLIALRQADSVRDEGMAGVRRLLAIWTLLQGPFTIPRAGDAVQVG